MTERQVDEYIIGHDGVVHASGDKYVPGDLTAVRRELVRQIPKAGEAGDSLMRVLADSYGAPEYEILADKILREIGLP